MNKDNQFTEGFIFGFVLGLILACLAGAVGLLIYLN